ncbi:MAG: hypothetical protein KC731_29015 [Myxococcales bacterium]|nr:hypothetical protein [Myxococcales bacterium]
METRRRYLFALSLALAFAGACDEKKEAAAPAETCRYELRDGRGSHLAEAPLSPGTNRADLEKRLRTEACEKRCAAEEQAGRGSEGCPARCLVDLDSGELGGRMSCSGG